LALVRGAQEHPAGPASRWSAARSPIPTAARST